MATTVNDIITEVDELKPNTYDDSQKIKWIHQLDLKIYDEVICTHEDYEDVTPSSTYDVNTETIVGFPYDDIYKFYLMAQIDFFNNETDRYTNSMIMFQSAYQTFCNQYNIAHRPLLKPLKLGV